PASARRGAGRPGMEPRRARRPARGRPAAGGRRAAGPGGPRRGAEPGTHAPQRRPAPARRPGEPAGWAGRPGGRRCAPRGAARGRRGNRPAAGPGAAAGISGPGAHRHRLPGGAVDRGGRSGLRRAPRSGRGGGGVRGAAVVPARAQAPAHAAHGLRRPAPAGAGIRAVSRCARTPHLGRHRLDPVQPAPAPGGPAMNASAWNPLVQPGAVASALGAPDVVVVDCRFSLGDTEAGARAYREGHLPGARYAHLDRDLSGPAGPGRGRHPWPDADAFSRRLSAWGIAPRSRVVAYDAGDGAFAARLWCLLRMLGHDRVAVLDGGWARWTALGLPVDATVPDPEPASYEGR